MRPLLLTRIRNIPDPSDNQRKNRHDRPASDYLGRTRLAPPGK
ncbi:hypothetical protein J2T11_000714 [Paenarthrobacter nicotinovorans]|nr:hypothetical protein [Paenarthrobacter nicotinovorans]